VNCRKARGLIDQLLDGALDDRTALDEHLAHCDACRSELARLQRVQDIVSRAVSASPDDARLEQLTAGILGAVGERKARAPAGARRLRWAPFVAAAVVAAFAVGLGMGRMLWPTEVVMTKLVPKREVVQKVVEVEVPVVKERVVVREVPVVRTRVVYRDRPAVPALTVEATGELAVPPAPVKADEFVVSLNANLVTVHSVVSREVHPVTVIEQPKAEQDQGEPEKGAQQDAREAPPADGVMLAQNHARAH
jgi:anti-sigma factor RsiW